MNVTITTPGGGGLQTEYSVEQNIRRCIEDGMLGDAAAENYADIEVSFDDAPTTTTTEDERDYLENEGISPHISNRVDVQGDERYALCWVRVEEDK